MGNKYFKVISEIALAYIDIGIENKDESIHKMEKIYNEFIVENGKKKTDKAIIGNFIQSIIYSAKGDKEKAINLLNKIAENDIIDYRIIESLPMYKSFKGNAEFELLLSKAKTKIDSIQKVVRKNTELLI